MKFLFSFLLVCLFVTISGKGQLSSTKTFSNRSGFCSTTITLDSLGNFYREAGCEGRSYIAYGRYLLRNGIIEFRFASFDSLTVYKEIMKQSVNSENNSIVSIQFLTNKGTPVPNNNFDVTALDSSGKFTRVFKLDETGKIFVNINLYKELRLTYLERILGKNIILPEIKSDVSVLLNLPPMFFYYYRPRLDISSVFSLRLKKDGLYQLNGKEKVYDFVQ